MENFLPILRRFWIITRLIVTTFWLPYSVLQCIRLIKLNYVLVGRWKSTEKTLHSYFLILDVRDIPRQFHKYFGIHIHSDLSQLMLMEFVDFFIILLLWQAFLFEVFLKLLLGQFFLLRSLELLEIFPPYGTSLVQVEYGNHFLGILEIIVYSKVLIQNQHLSLNFFYLLNFSINGRWLSLLEFFSQRTIWVSLPFPIDSISSVVVG